MTIHMRPYGGAADLQRILDLKRTCTTPENMYDAPTISMLRTLLAPLPQREAGERPLWEDEHETNRRVLLEGADFKPLPARDLRLVCSLDIPLPAIHLPAGFALRGGVHGEELERYQELHQAVFDGISMGLDYHQSPAYEPDLDLIAVDATGTFAAFCLCELTEVADSASEYTVGEIGVIGTRPTHQRRGLGRTLLLTGMHRLK